MLERVKIHSLFKEKKKVDVVDMFVKDLEAMTYKWKSRWVLRRHYVCEEIKGCLWYVTARSC